MCVDLIENSQSTIGEMCRRHLFVASRSEDSELAAELASVEAKFRGTAGFVSPVEHPQSVLSVTGHHLMVEGVRVRVWMRR